MSPTDHSMTELMSARYGEQKVRTETEGRQTELWRETCDWEREQKTGQEQECVQWPVSVQGFHVSVQG